MGQTATKISNMLPSSSLPLASSRNMVKRDQLRTQLVTIEPIVALSSDIITMIIEYTIGCVGHQYVYVFANLRNVNYPSGEGTAIWALPIQHIRHMLQQQQHDGGGDNAISSTTSTTSSEPAVVAAEDTKIKTSVWIGSGNRAMEIPRNSTYMVDTINDRVLVAGGSGSVAGEDDFGTRREVGGMMILNKCWTWNITDIFPSLANDTIITTDDTKLSTAVPSSSLLATTATTPSSTPAPPVVVSSIGKNTANQMAASRWPVTHLPSMRTGRAYSSSCYSPRDHRWYNIGALCYKSVEYYDIIKKRWSNLADMTAARASAACAVHPTTGQLFLFGGLDYSAHDVMYTAESYDPTSNKWTKLPIRLAHPRVGAAAIWVPHLNSIIIMSGGDQMNGRDSPLALELYDPATGTITVMAHWTLPVHMQYPRVQLIDDHILVVITNTYENLNRPGTYSVGYDETSGYVTDLTRQTIDEPLKWLPLPSFGAEPSGE